MKHEDSCYYINDTPTLKWSDARKMCQNLGGDLPKITSASEDKFLFNLVQNQNTYTRWGAWIGLYKKADTKFYWAADDSPLEGHYSNWSAGEPNNNGGHEDCVSYVGKGEYSPNIGKWNDLPCSWSSTSTAPVVVCQKSL